MRLFLALLFGTTLLMAAPVPKEKPKVKDEDAILGTWKIESFDTDGAPDGLPKELIDSMRFIFEKDGKIKMSIMIMGQPQEQKGEFKIDAEPKLKTIDLILDGQASKGLYELDGDTLKLATCDGPAKDRPTELKANNASKVALVTFKRVKEEEKKDK